MTPLRKSLLGLYQAVTSTVRMRAVRQFALAGNAPVCVLFYHRVADTEPNDWTMPVRTFQRQISWLSRRYDFVSLQEAQRRLVSGAARRPAVAITFDDGYGENCDEAIPLLLRHKIPFTYFVTTSVVRDQSAFPHDLAAGVRLRPNTITELRAMADAGVDIGAHTRTHPDLGASIDPGWLHEEIVGSMDDIEKWTGRRPRSFAFPFGQPHNLTPEAMAVARRAGARVVCSAYGAYNRPEQVVQEFGPYHLRRIHADPEWVRFLNWMTIDPRKLLMSDPINDGEYLRDLISEESGEHGAAPQEMVGAFHG